MSEKKEEEALISDKMVKMVTALIYELADQKGINFKEAQDRCKRAFGYTNLAKVSMTDGHAMIKKLMKWTGAEEQKPQLPTNPDEKLDEKSTGTVITPVIMEPVPPVIANKPEETGAVLQMREAIRAAVSITLEEVVDKKVPVQGLGAFVLELTKVIFEAKRAEEGAKDGD